MNLENLNINDFNYSLIKENIALYPEKNRDDSKLLIYNNGKIKSSIFSNILDFLPNETSIFIELASILIISTIGASAVAYISAKRILGSKSKKK